ncbi:MAG TPA: XRE family transcriptional regulator [Candidatus Saccharicenans sp.]|nr:XRE family transcriptional regulator [Candidatus Saccharicenans sp.]HOL45541.1 XRE family transcriptional regulator [Candidatus Saccharicenans sp.]HOM93808.1 XRE family transcriptional regulator [Candidatus Saccharicenans sp.]HOT69280.1 XRE family transcriptional regulator [Candidatus Saccharicenans sp.]HPC87744.1 XRE family transcriptional regulator [Candidatus Saccharicenans sp.]
MNELFSARLKKLREDMGLTQEELGAAVGLSSEYISLLEAGKRTPSIIALSRISRYFQKNVSYFLEVQTDPFEILMSDEKLSPAIKEVLNEFHSCCEKYLGLEKMTGRPANPGPLYTGSLSPENLAEEERRRIGLGNEPIRDIFRLCEINGCHLIRMALPEESKISGLLVFLEEKNAAFVLINSALPYDQQLVAAAHLYGHYLKDRNESPIIDNLDVLVDEYVTLYSPREQFAQAFASKFLIPPSKVRELIDRDIRTRRLSYADVLFLKRYFGVSTVAMLRTLRQMNYLSRSQFEAYFKFDHQKEEEAIFGEISPEGGERAAERGRLILPERFYLLKKEAELISEAVGDEPAEKDKNQKAVDMGKDNKQEESGKA